MNKPFNASAVIEKAEKEYGLGKGEYLKLQEGANKLRLLSDCIGHESEYQGRKTFRFVCWVLDRKDNVVKPYFMPQTIMRAIEALQLDPDYAFDSVPMPYDIKINAKNAGTKEVDYQVIASPTRTPLTEHEEKAFLERMPIEEFVQKLKDKAGEQEQSQGQSLTGYEKAKATAEKFKPQDELPVVNQDDDINVEDIPF